jgi:hypothetical protein
MANLQSTNVTGVLCVNGVAVGGGKDFKYCCFTASTTWTPSQDLVDGNGFIEANLIGGGGGGGGVAIQMCSTFCNTNTLTCASSKAGCVGELFSGIKDIDATDACTVTVGAGGTGGTINTSATWVAANCFIPTQSLSGGNTSLGDLIVSGGRGGADCFEGNQYICAQNCSIRCTFSCDKSDGQCSAGSTCLNYLPGFGGGCTVAGTYINYDTPNDRPKAGTCYGFIGEPNGGVMCGVHPGSPFAGGGTSRGAINFVFSNPGIFYCNLDATCIPKCKLAACTFGSAGGCGGTICNCNFESGGSNFQFFGSGSGGNGVDGIVVIKWQE